MGVNSLPKTDSVSDCDLNPGPTAPKSSTLTTRLPSRPELIIKPAKNNSNLCVRIIVIIISNVVSVSGASTPTSSPEYTTTTSSQTVCKPPREFLKNPANRQTEWKKDSVCAFHNLAVPRTKHDYAKTRHAKH